MRSEKGKKSEYGKRLEQRADRIVTGLHDLVGEALDMLLALTSLWQPWRHRQAGDRVSN
jgi:hypothetical protein